MLVNVEKFARKSRNKIKKKIRQLDANICIAFFKSTEAKDSDIYARELMKACDEVGISYKLHHPSQDDLPAAIKAANKDPNIHGIFVFFPIFHGNRDDVIRDLIDYRKSIEGLCSFWRSKLYENIRFVEKNKKAVVPCTPLAIVKILESLRQYNRFKRLPLHGKTITIFNRSILVGHPLAEMLWNDGANVFSFDVQDGNILHMCQEKDWMNDKELSRKNILPESDIIITGVSNDKFELIRADEIKKNSILINFSSIPNFTEEAMSKAKRSIPKMGAMTVAMCLRNTVRLFLTFHK